MKNFRFFFLTTFVVSTFFSSIALANTIKLIDLESWYYTKPSLANPHVVRIDNVQARNGRFAVLERVYDISNSSKMKSIALDRAANLFKKKGNNVEMHDIVPVMTAEKIMFDSKKFKQRIRVWSVAKPSSPIDINVPPVFDVESPQVIEPYWMLYDDKIVLSQESADHSTKTFYQADFKKKKLQKISLSDFPEIDREHYSDFNDDVLDEEYEEETDDGEFYKVRKLTIVNHKTGKESVIEHPVSDYVYDQEGVDTSEANPLWTTTGMGGFYLGGYTNGVILIQQGVTSTANNMENRMPDDWSSLNSVKAALNAQWNNVNNLDFGTHKLMGYRL